MRVIACLTIILSKKKPVNKNWQYSQTNASGDIMTNKLKKRKRSIKKSATGILKGLRISWSVYDPLGVNSEIHNERITHSNPIYSLMLDEIKKNLQVALSELTLKWHVSIEVEFIDQFSKTYYKGVVIVIQSILNEADGYYQEQIEKIFSISNMEHYVCTHITCSVLGNSKIIDKDFEL